jgi:hypothetical protein
MHSKGNTIDGEILLETVNVIELIAILECSVIHGNLVSHSPLDDKNDTGSGEILFLRIIKWLPYSVY